MHRIAFLTPTYKPDFERFCLQRESIERCGITLPHIAVVQHEDLSLFESVPHKSNLTLLSTRDVLPSVIERRRRAWNYRRLHWRRWIGWNAIHGWMSQQLIKLSAPQIASDIDAVVCLDSDIVFVRPVTADCFYGEDGRLHLYELDSGIDVEMAEYLGRSMRFLGISPTGKPLVRYTYAPAPMHCGVIEDVQQFIADRHGKHWINAVTETDVITEFATYGAFARYIDNLQRVVPVNPSIISWFWWKNEVENMASQIDECLADERVRMVGVQSNAGYEPSTYKPMFERVWCQTEIKAQNGIC